MEILVDLFLTHGTKLSPAQLMTAILIANKYLANKQNTDELEIDLNLDKTIFIKLKQDLMTFQIAVEKDFNDRIAAKKFNPENN